MKYVTGKFLVISSAIILFSYSMNATSHNKNTPLINGMVKKVENKVERWFIQRKLRKIKKKMVHYAKPEVCAGVIATTLLLCLGIYSYKNTSQVKT